MNKILKYFIMAIGVLAIGCLGVKNSPPAYYFIVGCYCQLQKFYQSSREAPMLQIGMVGDEARCGGFAR